MGQHVDRETNLGSILLMMALSIAGDVVRAQSLVTSTTPTATSSAPVASPTFDVASIKPSRPGVSGTNSDFNNET